MLQRGPIFDEARLCYTGLATACSARKFGEANGFYFGILIS